MSHKRRKRLETLFYAHIEAIFRAHGTPVIYLTPDLNTGIPFWQALSFYHSDMLDPDNQLPIYLKRIERAILITITASDNLNRGQAGKIAGLCHSTEKLVREWIFSAKHESNCFNVIAELENGEIIGRLFCLQNKANPSLWYYGDLFVSPFYRRLHIAKRLVLAAIEKIKSMEGKLLCCYVEKKNIASLNMQKSIGFIETDYKRFDDLINEDQKRFHDTFIWL